MVGLPSGDVTFVFGDIEGSTALWESDPEAMRASLEAHDALVRSSIEHAGGFVFKHTGDGFGARTNYTHLEINKLQIIRISLILTQILAQRSAERIDRPLIVRYLDDCGKQVDLKRSQSARIQHGKRHSTPGVGQSTSNRSACLCRFECV